MISRNSMLQMDSFSQQMTQTCAFSNHRGWKRIVDGVAKETARGCEVWEWNGRRILFEPSRRQHKMESQAGEEAATKKVGEINSQWNDSPCVHGILRKLGRNCHNRAVLVS